MYHLHYFRFFFFHSFSKHMQVSHVRSLHTNGCVQQQEAVALEPEPSPLSVFRAQENDPVSMSGSISHSVVTIFSWIVFVHCTLLLKLYELTALLSAGEPVGETYRTVLHAAVGTHSHVVPSRPPLALPTAGMCPRFTHRLHLVFAPIKLQVSILFGFLFSEW